MQDNHFDNLKNGFVSGSGRRFVSDAPKDYHFTSFETKNLLRAYSPMSSTPLLYSESASVRLEPHVSLNKDKLLLSFNICSEKTGYHYVLKDILEFLRSVDGSEAVSYGKHLSFVADRSAFTEETKGIIRFLFAYFRDRQLRDNLFYNSQGTISFTYAKGHGRQIDLSGHEIDEFLSSVSGVWFQNSDFRAKYTEERFLEIVKVFPPIELRIERNKNGITFESGSFTMFEGYSAIYFERRRKLHMVERSETESVLPFLKFLSARRTENELFVAEKDLSLFVSGLYPVIDRFFNVSCEGFDPSRFSLDTPVFRLYLDMPDPLTITCDLQAVYRMGKEDETALKVLTQVKEPDSGTIKRSLYLESQKARTISHFFDRIDDEKGLLVLSGEGNEDRLYSFITDILPGLSSVGDIYLSDAIRQVRITSAPGISLGVSVVSDLLELSIVPENLSLKELDEILTRYDRKRKYYRLTNGDILRLQSEDMELLYTLKDGLGLSSKQIMEGRASVPRYRALFLNELSEKSADYEYTKLVRGSDFKALFGSFTTSENTPFDIPESLSTVLRDYQKTGFEWLRTLKANSFGGILADDMGLGKTIQILALLLSLREEAVSSGKKTGCSLIVCPASLVYNWQHEIKKFTPSINCELAVGIKPDRIRVTSEIDDGNTDVTITSYDLLRRDIDLYKYLHFDCMIVDEAQFIKNPATQIARAVKSVSASFKVALTGTPIENRLSELWSIFDFCMPGYLFSYKSFKENLEIPVVQEHDDSAMDRIRKMIAPFLLRRLKKDVLLELPDKLEENIVTRMTDEQNELYRANLQKVRLMVGSKNEDEIKKDRIMILSELTRLRQICCDPGLIYEGYGGGSAKADLCVQMVKSASESGHKVLLFSQFTSMLERITVLLKKEDISYYLLTGSTKKEDRIKMVDAFQENDTSVFCISLKAGGTGLNLTAADIVIHFDHWWNIAVENQATDRAHRIGQKNPVTVYRLIMKDTIEEKIIELQNRKKELADQLLNTGGLGAPSLSKEELLELLG